MEKAIYVLLFQDGQMIHEMIYCDVEASEAAVIIDRLETYHPERIYYIGDVDSECCRLCLN